MADLVGSFISAAYNRQAQERAFEQQQQLQADAQAYNTLMWNKSNEYNSPLQQMARFKAAGLNPNLIYGQMANLSNPINMGSSSAPGPSHIDSPSLLESAQLSLMRAQKDNIEADTYNKMTAGDLNTSDVEKNKSVISLNETQEDLNNSMKNLNEAQTKKVNEEIPLIRTEVRKSFQEYRKLKVDADRANEFYDAQIRKLQADANLSDTQARDIINTYKARVDLLIAQANRENWTAKELEAQCLLLGEQYVQATYATKIAEASSGVEGTAGYQWTSHVLGLVGEAVGTVGAVMLGIGAFKGAGAAVSRAESAASDATVRRKLFEQKQPNNTTFRPKTP